jgi:hypothetical protein
MQAHGWWEMLTERGFFEDNIKNDLKAVVLEGVGWNDLA